MREETRRLLIKAFAALMWLAAFLLGALSQIGVESQHPPVSCSWVIITVGLAITASLNVRDQGFRNSMVDAFRAGMDAENHLKGMGAVRAKGEKTRRPPQ